MEFEVKKLFEDVDYLSGIHTKKDYEHNMNMFNERRYGYLDALVNAENYEEKSNQLCEEVTEAFKKFGKVRGGDLMNLNYYMIYYIFPAIQQNEDKEKAIRICDSLRDAWNSHFKSGINYTDYETLMNGFQTKIFGIPVGKK